MNPSLRTVLLFAVVAVLFLIEGMTVSWNSSLAILNMCLISAIMALGVNMQWGYAGLFNVGVVGFVALGGGLVSTTLGLAASLGSALAFGAAGVAAVLSGAMALSHYLRTTAPPTEGA